MAAPSAYTEPQFAVYLLDVLGATGTALDWSTQADVQVAIDEALLAIEADTIADATEIRKLRAFGRRELWRHVADATAGYHRFSADGASYDLHQIHEQAVKRLALAETDCMEFGAAGYAVTISAISYPHDPYGPLPAEDRTLP